jgi:choline dehydrogenase-like flavoprotein
MSPDPLNPPIEWNVVIVGAGIAGAIMANSLAKAGVKKILVIEAGPGVPPNINDFMNRFYLSSAKVPESPYPPELFKETGGFSDPAAQEVGRPSVLMLGSNWNNTGVSYLDQKGPRPFASTYERLAGGTLMHWLGISLRLCPSDFKMKSLYGRGVDWPIGYDDLKKHYAVAEDELGVSGDAKVHEYLGIAFDGVDYPMGPIPSSLVDQMIEKTVKGLTAGQVQKLRDTLNVADPQDGLAPLSTPVARNSEPFRNRRACAGNTNCIPICPIQAKYDPTITLNEAANNGVQFSYNTVAAKVLTDANKITGISYIRSGEGGHQKGIIKGKLYVLAGNAIETSRLLLMSKSEHAKDGVANSSGLVGCHLMDHPYYNVWGLAPEPVFPYRGPLATSGIEKLRDGKFRADRAAFRVDIGNEGWNFVVGGIGGDPNVTTVDFVNGLNRSGLNSEGSALTGVALRDKLSGVITRQFRLGFLVEQLPKKENRVTLSDKVDALGLFRPAINYDLDDYSMKGLAAARHATDVLFEAAGVQEMTAVPPIDDVTAFDIDGRRLNYGGAGHIMGTYRMGTDRNDSVVDPDQKSHDFPNLYLVGSGTFPTTATANPTLTLVALCMKTAEKIAAGRFP